MKTKTKKDADAKQWLLKVYKNLDKLMSDPLYKKMPISRLKSLLTEAWAISSIDLCCVQQDTKEDRDFLTPDGDERMKREYGI